MNELKVLKGVALGALLALSLIASTGQSFFAASFGGEQGFTALGKPEGITWENGTVARGNAQGITWESGATWE